MNDTKGAICAACGTWHYHIICPKCGSVVSIKKVNYESERRCRKSN